MFYVKSSTQIAKPSPPSSRAPLRPRKSTYLQKCITTKLKTKKLLFLSDLSKNIKNCFHCRSLPKNC